MDNVQREILTRRICSGKFFTEFEYKGSVFVAQFNDPSIDLLVESDFIYQNFRKNIDGITIEESYKILERDGVWSKEKQFEMDKLKTDIKYLKGKVPSLKFQKLQLKILKDSIQEKQEKLEKLEDIKNSLYPSTVEYLSEDFRRKWLIPHIVKINGMNFDEVSSNISLINILTVLYYKDNSISEAEIREIARKDPWRLYYTLSKDSGTPLFKTPSSEITSYQYNLVLWSKIYDFAYDCDNRPDDDIVEDDLLFDDWYDQEIARIKRENNQRKVEQSLKSGIGMGGSEVFLPADPEGAKEVYELNTPAARKDIEARDRMIEQKGVVNEVHLPDVNKNFKMEVNRITSQKMQRR